MLTGDFVKFTAYTAGANPWIPVISPDIDTYVDFTASFGSGSFSVMGKVRGDPFPNLEVFLMDGAGNKVLLLDFRTSGGTFGPLYKLWGDNQHYVIGRFATAIKLDAAGHFAGSTPLFPALQPEGSWPMPKPSPSPGPTPSR